MASTKRHLADARPEFLALGFLEGGAISGYDLYRRFDASLGKAWRISQSQMYLILKRLEAQGSIKGSKDSGERNQDKRLFTRTEQGETRFSEWLLAPTDCSTRVVRFEFLARLYFARRSRPGILARIVEEQRAEVARQAVNHRALLASLPEADLFTKLSLELRASQLEGIERWIVEEVGPLLLDSREERC